MTTKKTANPASLGKNDEPEEPFASKGFPIVGIGASAGGLEALSALLAHLPGQTGMAFVLIQHLDPTHTSQLSDLLSRVTKMPVSEARDGVAVERDHVYVIPPNRNLAILDGVLAVTPRGPGPASAIDFFFQALSRNRNNSAIGVVLSGTGSDGTLGLRAIKAEGGITFAQDQQSAVFGGMPHNAVASGNVDFVLPPEGIARELARIAGDLNGVESSRFENREMFPEETALRAAEAVGLGMLFAALRTVTGVDFSHYKRTTILRRIRRRMLVHQMDKLMDFHNYLKSNPAEVELLYQDLLINVTEFFRDPEVFEFLSSQVLPKVVDERPAGNGIRIWASGCSSGEEAYSLAITLLEFLGEKAGNMRIQVFGTDLSERAIEQARAGFYSESVVASVSADRLRRFFSRGEGGYRISKAIREMCVFARHNIFADPPFSHMDLISCRNVLIYMDSALQKQVLPIFHYALNPNGLLMLGSSEGIGRFSNLFDAIDKKHNIYSKKWAPGHHRFDFAGRSFPAVIPERALSGAQRGDAFEQQKELDRVLLAKYAPAAVLVSDDLEVLQSRGDTSPYLKLPAGKATLNLLKMAREGLGLELRNAIAAVKQQKAPIGRDGIQIRSGDRSRNIRIEVTPVKLAFANEPCLVVVFDETIPASFAAVQAAEPAAANPADEMSLVEASQIQQLEQELAGTKEHLQAVIERQETSNEELQSANEEISSANEELQSTNEELETSQEELQSTNEELNTVNDELRARNAELNLLTNDLANLLATVNIPIIMIGCDLRIRRLTPMAEKVLRVIPADVGRPITDIKLNLDVPDLEKLILGVIENLQPVDQDVQGERGEWYSLEVRPYRTVDNRIDGVVLSLQNIDALKRSEQAFRQSSTFIRSVVDTVREPLLVLDADLRVVLANQSFCAVFQVSPDETVGQRLYDLGNRQWDIPQLRTLLGEVLPKAQEVRDFPVEHGFPLIGHKTMLLNARQISAADQTNPRILLAIEDVTERKRTEEETLRSAERLASAGRIAATIAHEINNPLDALANLMYLLGQHSARDEASRDLVKRGEQELKRIIGITRQTLGLFSSASEMQEVALSHVLDETLELLGGKFREQSISVEKRYDVEGRIHAAPTELGQVFSNLLVNALAATTAGDKLVLHVFASRNWNRPERRGVRVVIADTGVGIPYEHQKKIFEPFFTTKGERGTGLGLHVISSIVRKNEGTIRLRSRTTKGRSGTCFSIFFPTETANAVSWRAPGNTSR